MDTLRFWDLWPYCPQVLAANSGTAGCSYRGRSRMDQRKLLDAGFLHAEDADEHASLAMGGLAVIDGPVPDQHAIMSAFAERMSVCPRFTQRLRTHLFDLSAPEWV